MGEMRRVASSRHTYSPFLPEDSVCPSARARDRLPGLSTEAALGHRSEHGALAPRSRHSGGPVVSVVGMSYV